MTRQEEKELRKSLNTKRAEIRTMDREKATAIMDLYEGPGGGGRYETLKDAKAMRAQYVWAYRLLYQLRPEVLAKQREQCRLREIKKKEEIRIRNRRGNPDVIEWYRTMWLAEEMECFYCHKGLPAWERQGDHYIPLSKGGAHSPENLRVSCARCNAVKGGMMPEEFLLISR